MTAAAGIHRRRFLVGAAGTAGAVAAIGRGVFDSPAFAQDDKPLPDYVSWKDPEALIVHSDKTIETERGGIGTGIVTPEDRLFVRNNVNPPPDSVLADRGAWQVEIGGVKQPKSLSVAELKTMGLVVVATVLQCSGNGRKYFQDQLTGDQKISGTPWTVGAAGCVLWSGVPLKAVVEALGGAADGVKFITGTGGEELPAGLDAKLIVVERSVPISTLENVILAWEMNGEPIPLAHGGPLRLIVPGYSGVNNIKYVKKVALAEVESDAKIQQSSYRLHPLGEKASPEHPSVWQQPVRSWITSPLEGGKAGRTQITGVAFGEMSSVAGVEVSFDGGANWQKAEFVGPDLGAFAWRVFVLPVDLAEGTHVLVNRATDSNGNVQPEEPTMNGGGYSHNGWRGPAVEIIVT